ncbi:hypothetical protein IR073_06335 [Gemella sp. 19428wG2_WT2a]|nr:hypothetical protein [Gemella sp. 19428wG2_WT2a]
MNKNLETNVLLHVILFIAWCVVLYYLCITHLEKIEYMKENNVLQSEVKRLEDKNKKLSMELELYDRGLYKREV